MNRRDIIAAAAALAACSPDARSQAASPASFPMRRGVNLGNALEAPSEGEWGYRIEAQHLSAVAGAGFDGVRMPVRWDVHMDAAGRIAASHMARVAEVVGWAIEHELKVQLDVHHYAALIEHPARETARFLRLWRQIAERFADASAGLMFEPLNEPHGSQWNGARLTDLQAEILGIIRESNPTRLVVFGPANWQNIDALERWRPPSGENIAVSVHYYEPHDFTHQDAEWLGDEAPSFGRAWGKAEDVAQMRDHIQQAAIWGAWRGYSMQLGEFGVNRAVTTAQRAMWTRAVREACEASKLAWCVWDFAGAFPIWDRERHGWIEEIRTALVDEN
ncbi:MAG: glycoside hydrolase family 5 protein [Hyphomonadaceae bacterium]